MLDVALASINAVRGRRMNYTQKRSEAGCNIEMMSDCLICGCSRDCSGVVLLYPNLEEMVALVAWTACGEVKLTWSFLLH